MCTSNVTGVFDSLSLGVLIPGIPDGTARALCRCAVNLLDTAKGGVSRKLGNSNRLNSGTALFKFPHPHVPRSS